MKVIKKIKVIVALLMLSFIGTMIVSCSSSKDDGGESKSDLIQTLRGNKWICRDASYGIGDNDHSWIDVESTTLYFTSDNAGVSYWVQRDYDTDLGNSRSYDYSEFTYSVDGNKVKINTENSVSELVYVDGYLSYNGGVYEKAAMSSGDYELLRKISPKTGSCGNGLTYTYNAKTKTLLVSGSGKMTDYNSSNQPWHDFYIEDVKVENGCTRIGDNAFVGKLQLADVSLPNTLTEIGSNAFAGTTLTKVSIPDNVKTIGDGAFSGCEYLSTVYLSDNLETVGESAFSGCAIKYYNLTLPDKVETVGDYAFSGWQAGTLTLNENLKTVGNGAFVGIKGTLTIPNSVESIGFLAFDGTYNKVVIGTGLKKLSKCAFTGSSSGGNMYVNLGNPLTIDGSMFTENLTSYDSQKKWTLYVPKGSKPAYVSDAYWKNFKYINEDASLTSGNGMPEPLLDYRNVTYTFDGGERTFKMVRVEGNNFRPFYIMQTEIPINSYLAIGEKVFVRPLDADDDGVVIRSEFRNFLTAIREETGIYFRLPTTAEWQYAAKGGNKSKGYKYSGSDDIDEVAWYKGNSKNTVHDVALKKPNELGLYDMSGNYAEVTSLHSEIITDNTSSAYHVLDGNDCGGSWKDESSKCFPYSWVADPVSGELYGNTGRKYKNLNAVDGRYISIRLVFTAPDK